jgi:hypothetical protein
VISELIILAVAFHIMLRGSQAWRD